MQSEPEDMRDENIWGFLGDVFEGLSDIQWDGAQVLLLLITALVPVLVFCFYLFIKARYETKK